jgi:hypothetical protein
MVHVQSPEAHPQTEAFLIESHWRRIGVVRPAALPGLRVLTSMVEQVYAQTGNPTQSGKGKQATISSVVIGINRYARSLTGMEWRDVVLDLAMALEACLIPGTKEEIGLTLKTRAAHLLGRNDEERDAIFCDIADLYQLRSDLIHGNAKFNRTPAKLFEARGFTQLFVDDQMKVLLDRWRDIVRRAICARLLLADVWPLVGDNTSVDRFLVRNDTREAWCQQLVGKAADLGLPLLVNPAPPLVDELRTRTASG